MYQSREAQLRAALEPKRRLSFTQPEPEDIAVTGQIVVCGECAGPHDHGRKVLFEP